MKVNLNGGQLLSITIAILGVLVASASQLNDLFGPAAHYIISASTMLMSIMSGVNVALQSQGSQIAAVQQMPGVEKITVNSQANGTLATMAVDPANNKIEPTPLAQAAVMATARAAE
jgi:hypothetical protein